MFILNEVAELAREVSRLMKNRFILFALAVMLALPSTARADDVTDQINEALAAYGRKDTPTAIAGLEAAVSLLRQGRAVSYGTLLPAPPSGWTADPVETLSVGTAMAGGGVGASRKYHDGDNTVTVSILADSPLLQAMSALASSGLAAIGGVQTQIVNGQRTIYIKDDSAFTAIVADKTLVRVAGRDQPEDTLKQFLTAVDFAAVERAAK
jgi:hypothetical protein